MHQERPIEGRQPSSQKPRWQERCGLFNLKKYGSMKTDIRFIRNANEIYARYADWSKLDRFYFIPLKLDMTYVLDGIPVRMAEAPIYLGTFIRNTLEHKDLFTTPLPPLRSPVAAARIQRLSPLRPCRPVLGFKPKTSTPG